MSLSEYELCASIWHTGYVFYRTLVLCKYSVSQINNSNALLLVTMMSVVALSCPLQCQSCS